MRKPRALRAGRPHRHRRARQPVRARRVRRRRRRAARARLRAGLRRRASSPATGYLAGSPDAARRGVSRGLDGSRRSPPSIAARGGYGSVQLLPLLDAAAIRAARQGVHRLQRQHVAADLADAGVRHGGVPRPDDRRAARARRRRATTATRSCAACAGRSRSARSSHPTARDACVPARRAGMLVGGTLTQLVASLGTPFAFDPPPGCVLFLDEVGERPYRLDRMLTQLRLSGSWRARRRVVFGELPRCDEPGGQPDRARSSCDACSTAFPARCCIGLPSGHTDGADADAAVRRARARRRRRRRPSLIIEEAAVVRHGQSTIMTRIHLIGVCGTAMATLAALLKSRGYDVRGSDQNVYPPMSDFLAQQGITTLQGYQRRAHHRRHRSGGRRQRDLARQRRARGSARSEDPLLLAARGRARSLPLGRAVDRHRRHARQDHDDVAGRLAAGARRRRSRACSSAASPRTSRAATASAAAASS